MFFMYDTELEYISGRGVITPIQYVTIAIVCWAAHVERNNMRFQLSSGVGAIVRMFWILDQKIGLGYFRFNPILK